MCVCVFLLLLGAELLEGMKNIAEGELFLTLGVWPFSIFFPPFFFFFLSRLPAEVLFHVLTGHLHAPPPLAAPPSSFIHFHPIIHRRLLLLLLNSALICKKKKIIRRDEM